MGNGRRSGRLGSSRKNDNIEYVKQNVEEDSKTLHSVGYLSVIVAQNFEPGFKNVSIQDSINPKIKPKRLPTTRIQLNLIHVMLLFYKIYEITMPISTSMTSLTSKIRVSGILPIRNLQKNILCIQKKLVVYCF